MLRAIPLDSLEAGLTLISMVNLDMLTRIAERQRKAASVLSSRVMFSDCR